MKIVTILLICFGLYIGSYVLFRDMHMEVWTQDHRTYVIFPSNYSILYFLYRPLSYLDQMTTGVGAHIGPHN